MARYVIRFLTAASAKRRAEGADDRHTLEDRIVLAGPIMEGALAGGRRPSPSARC